MRPYIDVVLIPLIRTELPALLATLRRMPLPRRRVTTLVFSLDSQWHEAEQAQVRAALAGNAALAAASEARFLSCALPPEQSFYIREARAGFDTAAFPYGLKSGPNLQFFTSMRQLLRQQPGSAVLLLETDAIPLGEYWLEHVEQALAGEGEFYLAGARYAGATALPDSIKHHINGNAVLNLAAPGFPAFLDAWEALLRASIPIDPGLAYDVVLEWALYHRQRLAYPSIEWLAQQYARRTKVIPAILNLAGEAETAPGFVFDPARYLPQLRGVSIVHCKAALHCIGELEAAQRAANGLVEKGTVLAYDGDWQYPAITEQHAFRQALALLPQALPAQAGYVYFGFPWATLIDLLFHRPERPETRRLTAILALLRARVPRGLRVFTVCQHIFMLEYQHLFSEAGITDVFWSHAAKGQPHCPSFPAIRIHPFPLFPVQAPEAGDVPPAGRRPYLFSFVGARARGVGADSKGVYLTDTRNVILHTLGRDARGKVIGREAWHYENVVYGQQIRGESPAPQDPCGRPEALEFRSILAQSRFSLCPSGTGPNSIRLWESLAYEAVPVILADTWQPPGDAALWQRAAVFCPENATAIAALPDRLERLAADEAAMEEKLEAMRQLWQRYGHARFIHDILLLAATPAEAPRPPVSGPAWQRLIDMARSIEHMEAAQLAQHAGAFVLGCSARVVENPQDFLALYRGNDSVRAALGKAMAEATPGHLRTLQSALGRGGIVLG